MKEAKKTTGGAGRFSQVLSSKLMSEYGMLVVLLLLCALFSILTIREQHPTGAAAGESLGESLPDAKLPAQIVIVAKPTAEDSAFVLALQAKLTQRGASSVDLVIGDPAEVRAALEELNTTQTRPTVILTTHQYQPVVESVQSQIASLTSAETMTPTPRRWPTFLLPNNIRNVANQITVIAIMAIGMTMIIITAGIDLSVGSLLALSAVVAAWLIARLGGVNASFGALLLGSLGGILVCGAVGAFSGLVITRFRIPPFIATLAMMQVAAGLAYIISHGMPIYQLPDSFTVLGRGADPLLGIPYAVILMILLYAVAQVLMSRTTMGRYIYAVGGNSEAARLAGIRVKGVLFFVYTVGGLLAGLGGILMASQLKSGAPTYGLTYELYVIAAVVVGGTSLMGGEGRVLGTLIGAFVIAVVQNGMNLTNVESYTQKVVLGCIILGAVLLDRLRQGRQSHRQ